MFSNDMKYVSVDGPLCSEIYLFPNFVKHDEFVSRMGFRQEDLLGAGFVSCNTENVEPRCYGKSTGLKLESAPGDTMLLHRMLGWDN